MSGFCCLFPITYISFILGWRNRLRHLQTQAWHKPVHHTVEQKPECQECTAHKKEALSSPASSTWMLFKTYPEALLSVSSEIPLSDSGGGDRTVEQTTWSTLQKIYPQTKSQFLAVKLGFSGFLYFYPERCRRTWLTVPRAQHQGAVWPAEELSALSRSPHWNRACKGASWMSAEYLTRWFVSLVCI